MFETVIILINYNSLVDTVECLETIYNIQDKERLVVVVENNSFDKDRIDSTLSCYENIKIIKNDTNEGFGKANNAALKWIDDEAIICKYIFLLNNDTLLRENTISLLEEELSISNSEIVMVTPKILTYNNKEKVWYSGGEINYNRVTPVMYNDDKELFPEFATGCAMFFRKNSLIDLRGFDPFFFMYDEDVELSIRIKKNNMSIKYVPEAIVYHKCQGSQTMKDNLPENQLHPLHPSLLFYLSNTIMNRKYIIKKHIFGFKRYKISFFHSFYWLAKSVQYFLFGKFIASYYVLKFLITPIK